MKFVEDLIILDNSNGDFLSNSAPIFVFYNKILLLMGNIFSEPKTASSDSKTTVMFYSDDEQYIGIQEIGLH